MSKTEPVTAPRAVLEALRRNHGRDCEILDANHRFHFGQSDRCSCGADEHNAKLDALLGAPPSPSGASADEPDEGPYTRIKSALNKFRRSSTKKGTP